MKSIAQRTQKGFTLVELLLVVALTSLAVGVTGDILVTLIRGYNKSKVITEIEQNANFVSQKLNKELRNATQIDQLDPAGASPPLQGETGDEITFIDRDGILINYKVENGIMTRNYDGGGDSALTLNSPPNGVTVSCPTTCFTLLEDSPQVVQISLRIEQAGSPSTVVFKGDISIEDTVVIRDTY